MRIVTLIVTVFACLAAPGAFAQTYPAKTIRLISPYLPGYEVTQWYGILVPAGTPAGIIERLHREIVTAMANPKVAQLFVKLGTRPASSTPGEFSALIRGEIDRWTKVIKAADIKAE